MYPEPAGFPAAMAGPSGARYDDRFREFMLPYRDVVESDDPDATVLAFLEATYAAGADLADWDRDRLERR